MLGNFKLLFPILTLTLLLPLACSQRQYVPLQNLTVSFHAKALAFTDDSDHLAAGGTDGILQIF